MRIEIRADGAHISGYVNATEKKSNPVMTPHGRVVEEIEPRAFAEALERARDVPLTVDHTEKVYASTGAGTMELREDGIGLHADATVTDPVLIDAARGGKIRGWSFGMYNVQDEIEQRADDVPLRGLRRGSHRLPLLIQGGLHVEEGDLVAGEGEEAAEEGVGGHPEGGGGGEGMEGDGGESGQAAVAEEADGGGFGEDQAHGGDGAGMGMEHRKERLVLAEGEAGDAEGMADLAGDEGLIRAEQKKVELRGGAVTEEEVFAVRGGQAEGGAIVHGVDGGVLPQLEGEAVKFQKVDDLCLCIHGDTSIMFLIT